MIKHFSSKNILFIFFAVPFISSILSTIHLISFAGLANPFFLSVLLATTFELGSLVSFIVGSGKTLLKKIKKSYVILMFLILFILQAFGNVYASYDYIRHKLMEDPTWLDTFMDMMLGALDLQMSKFIVSILIGLPIPLISLILLKSGVDYISEEEDDILPKQEKIIEPVIVVKTEDTILPNFEINKPEETIQTIDGKNNTIGEPYMQ